MTHSYSRLNDFGICPHRYRLKRDGVSDSSDRTMALAGQMAHMFYDRYLSACKARQVAQAPELTAELTEKVYQACVADGEVLTLQDWTECVDKLILPWVQRTVVDYGSLIGTEFALAVDEALDACPFDSPSAWLRGVVDALYISDDWCRLTDWKTGWDKDVNPDQMRCYALMVFSTFPHVRFITAEYVFTRFGVTVPMSIRREELPDIEARITAQADRISAETAFPATPGRHCVSCGVSHACKARPEAIGKIESLDEARQAVDMLSLYERDVSNMKDMLREWCRANGPVDSNGVEYGFHKKGDVSFQSVEKFVAACKAVGIDPGPYLKVDNVRAKKLHKALPDALEETGRIEFGKRRKED